jgi:hypothetical protein
MNQWYHAFWGFKLVCPAEFQNPRCGRAAPRRWRPGEGYRSTSMTHAAYRLLAMVLLIRMEEETNAYLSSSQAGGMKGRSTLDPLTVVTLTVARILETGESLAVLLTDYRQAFVSTAPGPMDIAMKEAGASAKVRAILRMIDLEEMRPRFWAGEAEIAEEVKKKEEKLEKLLEKKNSEHTEPQAEVQARQKEGGQSTESAGCAAGG